MKAILKASENETEGDKCQNECSAQRMMAMLFEKETIRKILQKKQDEIDQKRLVKMNPKINK